MGLTLRETQERNEQQWMLEGSASYIAGYYKRPFSTTDIGSYVMGQASSDLEQAIGAYVQEARWPTMEQQILWKILSPLDVAVVTLRNLMDLVYTFKAKPGSSPGCISSLSMTLGGALVDHLNWTVFSKAHADAVHFMQDFLRGKAGSYRHRTIKWWKSQLAHRDIHVDQQDRAAVGYHALKMAVEHTGLFEVAATANANGTPYKRVYPNPKMLEQIADRLDQCSWMHPVLLPMVCPPDPWVGSATGGYLTVRKPIVKTKGHILQELWDSGCLKERAAVLDRIGSTAFEINRELLPIMEEAYRQRIPVVPTSDWGVQLPPAPWTTPKEKHWFRVNKPDEFKVWATEMAVALNEFYNSRAVGKRMGFLRSLSIAKRFSSYEKLWFPWFCDYRGRMYPMASTLTPQGDDYSRALLRFNQRTPLVPGSPEWHWYLVHGANLWGHDKVSFDEREQFIRMKHEDILLWASAPLDNQGWTDADKPWCFLSWAMEYRELCQRRQTYSQLPIMLDGKCNGLQHLSLAVRDKPTAQLVSLVPLDKPSDIYSEVCDRVSGVIPEDSYWFGKVTRKLVKRNTMTTPYNVTKIGMGEQLKQEVISTKEDMRLTKEDKRLIRELRDYNWDTIMGLLGATADLMRWYSLVAKAFTAENLPLSWELPDGFRVVQDIRKTRTRQVKLSSQTVVINLRQDTQLLDMRRNQLGLSPNVTHSCDAFHMAQWIRTLDPDAPIWCVHDSFGTSVSQVNSKARENILRTLVDFYRDYSPVEELRRCYRKETVGLELPEAPPMGQLQLEDVLLASYAFA